MMCPLKWMGLCVLILGISLSKGQARNHDQVIFVAYSASEPLIIMKKTRVRGIVTDIVRQIFRASPYELETRKISVEKFERMLGTGLEGNWITYGSPNWLKGDETAGKIAFSQSPLFDLQYSLVSSRPSVTIEKISDLIGQRLVLIKGYHYPELEPYLSLDSGKRGITPFYVTDRSVALNMVREKRADYFLSGTRRAYWTMHILGYSHEEIHLQDFSHQIPNLPIHIAYNRNAPDALKALIDQRLESLLASDLLPRLIRHYDYNDTPSANG